MTEALNSVPGVSFGGIKPYGTFTHHLLPYYDEFESASFIRFAEQARWKSEPDTIRGRLEDVVLRNGPVAYPIMAGI